MAGAKTQLRRLTKRSQFLRAARGKRAGRPAFALQAVASVEPVPGIGFTVTKKTGNSPERNRIKRRLRAVVQAGAAHFQPQHDYVLVGRRDALNVPFAKLVADLGALLVKVHAAPPVNRSASARSVPAKPIPGETADMRPPIFKPTASGTQHNE